MSENKQLTVIEQREITFYDDQVIAVKVEDEKIYVPIRPICDLIGVDSASQRQRIDRDLVLSEVVKLCDVVTTSQGQTPQRRTMTALPLDYLNGWLFGINAKRVNENVRPKLLQYQRDCYQVLYEAFGRNEVTAAPDPSIDELLADDDPTAIAYRQALAIVNMAREQVLMKVRMQSAESQLHDHEDRLQMIEANYGDDSRYITNAQSTQIAQAVKQIALELGKRSKRNEFGGVYGEVHRQFSIPSYKQLPAPKFSEAMNFLRQWWETLTDGMDVPF